MKNVHLLYSCLILFQCLLLSPQIAMGADAHEEKQGFNREQLKPKQESGCEANARSLSAFANGESQNFKPVVAFLTNSECLNSARSVGLSSIREGIGFDSKFFKLDKIASKFPNASLEELRALENDLVKRIPVIIRNENPRTSELVPIIGQMAVLSPVAGRKILGETISLELQNAENVLPLGNSELSESDKLSLAKNLMKMGANEPLISKELSATIEEKAILAEADSLKRILLSLSSAASVQAELIPTFIDATQALDRGMQRGKSIYQAKEKGALLFSTFAAADSLKNSAVTLDAARENLDNAIGTLLSGESLTQSKLKKMWKDVLRVLALSDRYSLLAQALSESLTYQSVYLSTWDQARLLTAAKNYPAIGFALQKQFVVALQNLEAAKLEKTIPSSAYSEKIAKHFMPIVSQVLAFEQERIEPHWMAFCLEKGLVLSEDIEKRFPKFVLNLMDRRNKAVLNSTEAGVEPILNSMAENMAVLWSLGAVHVPALNKWVGDNEGIE